MVSLPVLLLLFLAATREEDIHTTLFAQENQSAEPTMLALRILYGRCSGGVLRGGQSVLEFL